MRAFVRVGDPVRLVCLCVSLTASACLPALPTTLFLATARPYRSHNERTERRVMSTDARSFVFR